MVKEFWYVIFVFFIAMSFTINTVESTLAVTERKVEASFFNMDNPIESKEKSVVKSYLKALSIEMRLAAYNVLFGNWGSPKRIGEMFKPYNLDIICFSEVPDGNWTALVGKELGMEYAYVGKISSANHKDKFKSILSRTPLFNLHEIEINAEGWGPASMVGAETEINGANLLVYSLHIPGRPYFSDTANGSASEFIANKVLPKIKNKRFVIMGDFNNHLGDAPLNLLESKGMRSTWADLNIDIKQKVPINT